MVLQFMQGFVPQSRDDMLEGREVNGSFVVRGDAPFAAVNLRLNRSLEADDADTLSGCLTAEAGQAFQVGDKLDLQGAVGEVVEVDGTRVTRTRVTLNESRPE